MEQLRKGDPCPCCGKPIKTNDPDQLRLLTWIAKHRRFPSVVEIISLLEEKDGAE